MSEQYTQPVPLSYREIELAMNALAIAGDTILSQKFKYYLDDPDWIWSGTLYWKKR